MPSNINAGDITMVQCPVLFYICLLSRLLFSLSSNHMCTTVKASSVLTYTGCVSQELFHSVDVQGHMQI